MALERYSRSNGERSSFDWTSSDHGIFMRRIEGFDRYNPPRNYVSGDGNWQGALPKIQALILPEGSRVFGTVEGSCSQNYSALFIEHERLFAGIRDRVSGASFDLDVAYIYEDAFLLGLLARLDERFETRDPFAKLEMDALIAMIGVHIAQNYSNAATVKKTLRGGLSERNLTRVKDYIEEHLDDLPELAALAALVDLTPHHFSRSFKQSAGQTVSEYAAARRVSRCCQLLETTGESITSIAYQMGFSSPGRMTESFKRTLGMTPVQYRKMSAPR